MEPLYLLTILVAAGVAAQWLAAHFRLPAILILLACGLLLGPVLGVMDSELLFGATDTGHKLRDAFVSLAVAIVLFEGGMTLNLREARHVGKVLRRLLLSGLIVGFGLGFVVSHFVCGLDPKTSSVLAAILVVTGPTVILPMLRGARIAQRPATLLKWEGIVNDPLGALLAYVALQFAISGGSFGLTLKFIGISIFATAVGAGAGFLLGKALNRGWITEHIKSPVILASVLVVFSGCEAVGHESGLLAVTGFGLILANVDNASIEDIRRFKEQVTTVLVSMLFILLSAQLDANSLRQLLGAPALFVVLLLFVIRPIVGFAGTFGVGLPWRERFLIGWIAPRGVVAAAVAGAFTPELKLAGAEDWNLLTPIVFGVILSTVVLHGLSLRPLAQKLGLAATEGKGILIVGASVWGVSLAQALARTGADVVLADTRFRRVSRARMEGLEVHHGDVLAEDTAHELPMERVSWVLAAADDDAYNALVCLRFSPELGREHTLQLTPAGTEKGGEVTKHMQGRNPWGDNASYRSITARFWKGASFKTTSIGSEFKWEDLIENVPDAQFLFYLAQGRLRILEEGAVPPKDCQLVYLSDESANVR